MSILYWDKPEKVLSHEEWSNISADGAPPGVYSPNMSQADKERWKAKLVAKTTDHPSVEIRKTINFVDKKINWGTSTQILLVVTRERTKMSMNGASFFTPEDWTDMFQAEIEARSVLDAL